MYRGKGPKKNKSKNTEGVFLSIKSQGITDTPDNREAFRKWFENPKNLEGIDLVTDIDGLTGKGFPSIFDSQSPAEGKVKQVINLLKQAAAAKSQTESVVDVIPVANVRKEDTTNIKKLNDFLNQENLDQNLSSLKDKAGRLALDASGSFMITNSIANTFGSYKELLSTEDIANLKTALQGAFSDLTNNHTLIKKIIDFNKWFITLGKSDQKKLMKNITITPAYMAIIDETPAGKTALNMVQSKVLKYVTDFNSENKATRLLIVSYYFIGQSITKSSDPDNNSTSSSDTEDDDSDDSDDDIYDNTESTQPYKVYANDLSVAFDNAIGYIVASQLARRAPANSSTIPLKGLPKETQDDILARYDIPQLMDSRRDQLFVANPLLIPNGYKDQDNMPLINPESEIKRLAQSTKHVKREMDELKKLMFGKSDALVNPRTPSTRPRKSTVPIKIRYPSYIEANQTASEKRDTYVASLTYQLNAKKITSTQFREDINKYDAAHKDRLTDILLTEKPDTNTKHGSISSSTNLINILPSMITLPKKKFDEMVEVHSMKLPMSIMPQLWHKFEAHKYDSSSSSATNTYDYINQWIDKLNNLPYDDPQIKNIEQEFYNINSANDDETMPSLMSSSGGGIDTIKSAATITTWVIPSGRV
jgi:hypothetical protein